MTKKRPDWSTADALLDQLNGLYRDSRLARAALNNTERDIRICRARLQQEYIKLGIPRANQVAALLGLMDKVMAYDIPEEER